MRILLHLRSVTLLSRSAMIPLNGLQNSDVIEKSPTIKPAIVIVVPIPTRYFERIVATI